MFRTLEEITEISQKAHLGQYRFDGVTPYFAHVEGVALSFSMVEEGSGLRAVSCYRRHIPDRPGPFGPWHRSLGGRESPRSRMRIISSIWPESRRMNGHGRSRLLTFFTIWGTLQVGTKSRNTLRHSSFCLNLYKKSPHFLV